MSYSSEVLADSPLYYYRLADASGTTMVDSSGNALDGTYFGSPTLGTTGLLTSSTNTAATFSGTTQYGASALSTALDSVGTLTVEAWIKPSSVSSTPMIIGRDSTTPADGRSFQFRLNAGKLEFLRLGTTATATSSSTLSTGTTYHVAAVYNGTDIRLYINGALNGTPVACTGVVPSAIYGPYIGARKSSPGTNYFNGVIDEVAIYTTALSATRIAAHYNAGIALPTLSGTLDVTLPKVTASLDGTYSPPPIPVGSLDAVLPFPTVAFSGTYTPPTRTGTLDAVLPVVTADLAGTYTALSETGALSVLLPRLSVALVGTYDGPITTDLSNALDGLDLLLTATVTYAVPVAAAPAGLAERYDVAIPYPVPVMVDGRPT